jgi:hypothetical protein
MKRIWTFLSNPANLAIVALAGAAFAFVWKEMVKPALDSSAKPPIQVQAGLSSSAPVAAQASPSPAIVPVEQNAEANGGNAVIANDHASVSIGK